MKIGIVLGSTRPGRLGTEVAEWVAKQATARDTATYEIVDVAEYDLELLDDPVIRAKIAQLEIKLESLKMANYRAIAAGQLGHAPGPEASILKLRGTEIQQEAFDLAMLVMGHNSLSWFNEEGVVPPREQWVASSFNYIRAATIYAGSNEIQKNIIAKLILGLPS